MCSNLSATKKTANLFFSLPWRNGRRCKFKICCFPERVGSNPTGSRFMFYRVLLLFPTSEKNFFFRPTVLLKYDLFTVYEYVFSEGAKKLRISLSSVNKIPETKEAHPALFSNHLGLQLLDLFFFCETITFFIAESSPQPFKIQATGPRRSAVVSFSISKSN